MGKNVFSWSFSSPILLSSYVKFKSKYFNIILIFQVTKLTSP